MGILKIKQEEHVTPRDISKRSNTGGFKSYKNMTADCLTEDCLIEIFMRVPACERPKLAIVCQKWKEPLEYSWSNVRELRLTHWKRAENPDSLEEQPTPDEKIRFLRSLLSKCGRYLTHLDLTACGYRGIVPVINRFCPNLVRLRLRSIGDADRIEYNAFIPLWNFETLEYMY